MERLFKDDALVEGYLAWRQFVVEDTLKMMDESLQWRKEFTLNGEYVWNEEVTHMHSCCTAELVKTRLGHIYQKENETSFRTIIGIVFTSFMHMDNLLLSLFF